MKIRFFAMVSLVWILNSVHVEAQDGSDVQIRILIKTTSSWDGGVLPFYPAGQPELTIAKIIIPPGKSLPFHQHPVINAGVVGKPISIRKEETAPK